METDKSRRIVRGLFRFLPYLWGMETTLAVSNKHWILRSYRTYEEWKLATANHPLIESEWTFLPYLWGMETMVWHISCHWELMFLPYLWGMETLGELATATQGNTVLTVPMRNGNLTIIRLAQTQDMCSYRTYEEWKLDRISSILLLKKSSYRTYEEWKPHSGRICFASQQWFLPYLWGMETLKAMLIAERNVKVLTVPMRNGNTSSR